MSIIYQIKNLTNNKIYIGSSTDFEKRKSQHISRLINGNHDNIHLQRSFNNSSIDNFEFSIIEDLNDIPTLDLHIKEDYYIKLFNTKNDKFGYNIADASGGDCITNLPKDKYDAYCKKQSDIGKLRFSLILADERKKLFVKSGELNNNYKPNKINNTCNTCGKDLGRRNYSINCQDCSFKLRSGENNAFFGKTHTDECKSNMSDIKKQFYKENPEYIETMRKNSQETWQYPEYKEKMSKIFSEAHKGLKHTDEVKMKIGNAHRGKVVSEETRQKLREINSGKSVPDDIKQKIKDSMMGMRWYNNGSICKRFKLDETIPDEFKLGRKLV